MIYRIEKYYKNFHKPTSDLCINCKNSKPVSDIASIEYQDGKIATLETGATPMPK